MHVFVAVSEGFAVEYMLGTTACSMRYKRILGCSPMGLLAPVVPATLVGHMILAAARKPAA